MAHEIVMPQLGLSMDSGQIIQWLKKPTESVRPGEILLEVESDKSVVEVEAIASGRLHIVYGPEAGPVKVGQVIGYLLMDGEAIPGEAPDQPEVSSAAETAINLATSELQPQPDHKKAGGEAAGARRPPSTPAARRRATDIGVNWQQAIPTGQRGQIRERDILALAAGITPAMAKTAPFPAVQITPVARRLAEATGVDLAALANDYPGKKLEREDVERALRKATAAAHPAEAPRTPEQPESTQQPAPALQGEPAAQTPAGISIAWPLDEIQHTLPAHREALPGLRRVVAERMASSSRTNAPVTLTTKADAEQLVSLRTSLKNDTQGESVPSYNVILATLVARALRQHPLLNAVLDGDQIIYWDTVNLGIAVDTPRGLVVPVLRNVETKSLSQVSREGQELLARAAEGKALPDELSGGTFTLTNLGPQEIDFFTPIINPPQSAVLGVGRLQKEMVVINDQPAMRVMMPLSLTFDHRLVDGAPAARFLQRVKQYVEQPYLWLR
jgi:pyruvate dehydrogenase E2 component (dihydrolipoamide acetyltransferase)